MIPRHAVAVATPILGLLVTTAMTGSASAATTQTLGCRASVARVAGPSGGLVAEPFVADPDGAPCASDTAGLSSSQGLDLPALSSAWGGSPQIGPAQAATTSTDTDTSLGAASSATVDAASIPTPAGPVSIVGPAQATAAYECVSGTLQATTSSTLTAVRIGAQQIALGGPGAPATIPLYGPVNALGQAPTIGVVSVNENTTTGTSDTETLLDVHLAGVGDVVLGEAVVSRPASGACAGVPNGGTAFPNPYPTGTPAAGTPSGPAATVPGCPAGTIVDGGACVLATADGVAFVQDVGSGDVTGARIVSLADARRHYRSACLRGRGPAFVVVGTRRANRITVRRRRFRVLGLGGNDRITVVGGSRTCVDGGAGNDRIVNLKANRVSLHGGAGNDRIHVGNGPASISGGAGGDRILAGHGRVVIDAGSGRNVITARGTRDRVSATGRLTVAHLMRPAARYARRHGIRRVFVLR